MKKLLLLSIFLVQLSCTKKELTTYDEMKSDTLLTESFTENELKDLAKIVDFFESQMCNYSNEQRLYNCYVSFLKKDSTSFQKREGLIEFIDYDEQKKLYKKIDPVFFEDLWFEGETTMTRGDFEFKQAHYILNVYRKKYPNFLEKFAKGNNFLESYAEGAAISGDFIFPSSPITLTMNYSNFDLKDIKIRLIYALYYLNINESRIQPKKRMRESLNKK